MSGGETSVEARLRYMETIARPYYGSRYFFPAAGGANRGIHPLMAWWAVLHALSILVRYQPAKWATHIDIDRSRAVAIEQLLRKALTTVPTLSPRPSNMWHVPELSGAGSARGSGFKVAVVALSGRGRCDPQPHPPPCHRKCFVLHADTCRRPN
jgi:hypothetical protein